MLRCGNNAAGVVLFPLFERGCTRLSRLNRLTRIFHWLRRSFWLMPMAGCTLGIGLAWGATAMDARGIAEGITAIDPGTVRDLLTTVAGATATIMSLTYTLTLLIFTLAAGQLGPRLLDSFYDNRVNQIAIGIMGLTLTYSLVALFLLPEDRGMPVTGSVAIASIVLTVGTLIWFVHDVSQRILVDNEISRAAQRLDAVIAEAFRHPDDDPAPEGTMPERDAGAARVIHACHTGYLRSIDVEELVADMRAHDALVEMLVAPGDYVVARMPVALVHRRGSIEDWDETVNGRLAVGRSRSSEGDILFSANLLVEIALRALSPGINDSFTAISAVDQLSGAFATLLHRHPASPYYTDEDGVVRVMAGALTAERIVDTALHPIRRNAAGNLLVSTALLDALSRLMTVSDPAHHPLLRRHAALVGETALPDDATRDDRDHLRTRLSTVLSDAA